MIGKIIIYSALFLFSTNAYSQSPWINNKGSFYGQISFTYLGYSSIVADSLNTIVPVGIPTRDITTNLFADYSITDRLAVLVSLPYKIVKHDNQSLSSLGDPSVKMKYEILEDIPFSGYLGYTAPLSKREGVLRTGYKQHAIETGLSIGKGKERSFIYGGLGYRYRTAISDQVLVEFEYGYQFQVAKKPLYLIFHVDASLNTSSVEDLEAGQAMLFHNNGEFISPAVKFSYNAFGNFWINLAGHSAVLVRNFGAASTLTGGLAYKIEK